MCSQYGGDRRNPKILADVFVLHLYNCLLQEEKYKNLAQFILFSLIGPKEMGKRSLQ